MTEKDRESKNGKKLVLSISTPSEGGGGGRGLKGRTLIERGGFFFGGEGGV